MTGEPHATLQSTITTWALYIGLFGSLFAYGIRAHLRERRELRELKAAAEADRLRAMRRRLERRQHAPLATVGARIPARRMPAFYECESIWDATLAMGEPPDLDLLDEWERFGAELDRRVADECDDDGIA